MYERNEINPVTRLDYPDVDVIRVENTYYMVSTTMHFMPGCEILRSYDLMHWEHMTYVYDRLDSTEEQCLAGGKNAYGKGMWAASLRYHNGRFYVCFVANDTGKTYLYTADEIEGPWEKRTIPGFYHDCSLLFDDDGRVYIVYGNKTIHLQELKADLSEPKEDGLNRVIVTDEGNERLGFEGCHFYKIHGRYYLFMIHSLRNRWMRTEACYVSDSLTGEFRGGDILEDTMGYCGQGVAQGGIVDTPDGDWYAMLFQDRGAVGRIPILIPLKWERNVQVNHITAKGVVEEYIIDGAFPVLGENGRVPGEFAVPVPKASHNCLPLVQSDDFTEFGKDKQRFGSFGFKSCWQFNHEPDLTLVRQNVKEGQLEITCGQLSKNVTQAVNTLTQRMCYPGCVAEVTVDALGLKEGDYAGICALQGCYGMAAVTKRNGEFVIVMHTREAEDDSLMAMEADCEEGTEWEVVKLSELAQDDAAVRLRAEVDFIEMKDEVRFFYQTGCNEGETVWKQIGPVHKLYFKLDHFTGCRFGLFAYATKEIGGTAAFRAFEYYK